MRKFLLTHIWFIGALALVMVAALPVLTYPMWRDHGMYANIARAILSGGTPYIDMWDIKPPPVYYIYAAGITVFGSSTAAIRAIDFVFVPLAAVGMYWLGTRIVNRRAGVLAVILYGVFYFTETYASLTQSDSLVTLPMIAAAVCAVKATDTHGRRAVAWSFITGLICGLILWFKHYNLFFVAALIIHHVWIRVARAQHAAPLQQKIRAIMPEAAAFIAGGLITAGGLLVYFWSKGMIQEMLYVAQGTAAYNAQGYDLNEFLFSMRNYLGYRWRHWGVLVTLVALGIPLKRTAFQHFSISASQQKLSAEVHGDRETETARARHAAPLQHNTGTDTSALGTQHSALRSHHSLLFLWILAGLAFVLIQAKGFDTHWIPMMPALALLAAESLELLVQRIAGFFERKNLNTEKSISAFQHFSHQQMHNAATQGRVDPAHRDGETKKNISHQLSHATNSELGTQNSELSPQHLELKTENQKLSTFLYALATAGLLIIVLHSTWFRAFDYLTGRESRVEYFSRFDEGGDLLPAQSVQIVEWLQQRVAPGDTIYIWGFRPEVAYMGGWRPATRFQAQFPVVAPWYPPEWKQENVDVLWAAMPPYVLVLEADYMPWVNGTGEDSHQLLVKYTELNNWLIANYERQDEKAGHFLIWKRRS